MSLIDHRLQAPLNMPEVLGFDCPSFSSFRYIQATFPRAGRPIHRVFSLARMAQCHVFVSEKISSVGLLNSNDKELIAQGGTPKDSIYRLSFWRTEFKFGMSVFDLREEDLFGYAIIKHDEGLALLESGPTMLSKWYVFEAVFEEEKKRTSFVTHKQVYHLSVGSRQFQIVGVLYCQQNAITKVCAHVAIRSLLSRMCANEDVDNHQINEFAKSVATGEVFDPRKGFDQRHMKAILDGFGVSFYSYSYLTCSSYGKVRAPYQAYVYSGVESGFGSLLHFKFNPSDQSGHVVPIYGHTFNRQTWVPDAEMSYFMLSKEDGYIRSDSWISNFLAHDDNFGSNYCIPRKQIAAENVYEVTVLQEPGVRMIGPVVEAAVKHILDLWVKEIDTENLWNQQIVLLGCGGNKIVSPEIVLRTVVESRDAYLENLATMPDGQGHSEDSAVIDRLKHLTLPDKLMMVEVSLPQLFPANKHRIGEFLFDASSDANSDINNVVGSSFLFARMPGSYLIAERNDGRVCARRYESALIDHVKLCRA